MPLEKVYKYLIVSLGCMFISPLVTHAECSYERQAELSRIASNVQFNYNYEFKDGVPIFTATMTNLTNDIYVTTDDNILNADGSYTNKFSGVGEKQVRFAEGTSAQFEIFSADSSCYGEHLLTQYLTMPSYNPYSQSEECKNYPDFKYCQMWTNSAISTTQFNQELEKYKNVKNAISSEEDNNSWLDTIKEFIFRPNILIPLVAILIAAAIAIAIKVTGSKRKVV